MKEIIYKEGLAFTFVALVIGIIACAAIFAIIINWLLSIVAKNCTNIYLLTEWIYYKKEFKEWMKNKPRITKENGYPQ